jgi:hypothetical protein
MVEGLCTGQPPLAGHGRNDLLLAATSSADQGGTHFRHGIATFMQDELVSKEELDFVQRQRTAEDIPLHLIAPMMTEILLLRRRFDPLGD